MHTKTSNMDEDKKRNIITAAIDEFAQNGYEKASTNNIVKAAGISKGLLFHYFQNKKGLFSFVFDYCIDLIVNEYLAKIDLNQRDILARLRGAILLKIGLAEQFPQIFDFVQQAYLDEAAEVNSIVRRKEQELLPDTYRKLFTGIDYDVFKNDIDRHRAIKVIMWTLEKYSEEFIAQIKRSSSKKIDYYAVLADVDNYLSLFRSSFYRNCPAQAGLET